MADLQLPRGLTSLISDEDVALAARFTWRLQRAKQKQEKYYALTSVREGGRQRTAYLHRLITNAPKGVCVDHINGDTLDNRRENLRLCTPLENARNSACRGNSTGFKGVSVYVGKGSVRYRASIKINGRTVLCGRYDTAVDAARAYDRWAIKHFGDFAKPNFPISPTMAAA